MYNKGTFFLKKSGEVSFLCCRQNFRKVVKFYVYLHLANVSGNISKKGILLRDIPSSYQPRKGCSFSEN